MSTPDDPVDLPVLDEPPKVWRDGEEMLAQAAHEADPQVIAEGEAAGADTDDWVEE